MHDNLGQSSERDEDRRLGQAGIALDRTGLIVRIADHVDEVSIAG